MVSEATKAPCGNQGSPQPGSPRSHGASRQGITAHIVTSKQRTTKPCRNESGQTFFFSKKVFFVFSIAADLALRLDQWEKRLNRVQKEKKNRTNQSKTNTKQINKNNQQNKPKDCCSDLFCQNWRSFNKQQRFCKCNRTARSRGTRLLTEGFQPSPAWSKRVANLCQHVVWNCLGVVVVGFSSMAWEGCFFCSGGMPFSAFTLTMDRFVRIRHRSLLCVVLVSWCVVCSPSYTPNAVRIVCRPEFSVRLKNNCVYLKPDESFVHIGGRFFFRPPPLGFR